MNINFKDIENHYDGDDWRLFNHNDFNTVNTLDIKHENILIDKKSGTTLVQTSVGYANNADEMLFSLFKSACEI